MIKDLMPGKPWLLSAALLINMGSAQAHEHWGSVEVSVEPLRNGIYAVFGDGGNLAVSVGEDGTFMVDDQYAPMTDKILGAISEIGGDTPKFLLNTHWHFDHTGGNENLGKQSAIIMAHHQVRAQMSVDNSIEAFGLTLAASSKEALPVITFGDDLQLHFNGETIEAIHVPPAHTDGDSVVRFANANIVHTGDIWFNGSYPFIDVEHGGNLAGVINAASKIIDMVDDDTLIIPGHGPVGGKADLVKYRDSLQTMFERLNTLKQQGLTLEQVIERKPLADLDAEWGGGFLSTDRWLAIVYSGLE